MDATKGNIYAILNGNKQFLIPVYQRYYSWETEQCSRLWNDIVDMQKKDKVGHFVGSIVNIAEQAMPTGVQKYMIIDGQQRLTTLSLLLIALRDYAEEHPEDGTINARRIDNMLLKNEYEDGDERYKLLLTETDRDLLISLVEKKPISDLGLSRILSNYNFFAGKIADMELQPKDVYEAIGKLQIVNITLDRNVDDAQAILKHAPELIQRSVAFKAEVVTKDEKEGGLRKLLNFGHSIGHAIEAASAYQIPHGQAVAMGMRSITRAAVRQGLCESSALARLEAMLARHHLNQENPFKAADLLPYMKRDKKAGGGRLTLVVPRRIGGCELREVSWAELPDWIG